MCRWNVLRPLSLPVPLSVARGEFITALRNCGSRSPNPPDSLDSWTISNHQDTDSFGWMLIVFSNSPTVPQMQEEAMRALSSLKDSADDSHR